MASRQIIVAACDLLRKLGVRCGMTLASARAICSAVQFEEHQPQRDRRALEALARWMMRLSPVVDCTTGAPPEGDYSAPHAIFMDVSGMQRLYHGLDRLMQRLSASLSRLRITHRLAIAPTPGAAWALAYAGGDGSQISNLKFQIENQKSQIQNLLSPLPPAALRLCDPLAQMLHHLGIDTIGQLLAFPRHLLPSRFGPELLRRVDQALGRIDESLVPLEYQAPIEAGMEFDFPVTSLEALWAIFQNLIGQVLADMKRRGLGIRRLDLRFTRNHAPAVERSITLSRPSRNAANIFNLYRCVLDSIITTTVARAPRRCSALSSSRRLLRREDGFVGVFLRVPQFERLSDEQIRLLEQEEYEGRLELDRLLERLRMRLGEGIVVRPALVESHVPEKAFALRAISDDNASPAVLPGMSAVPPPAPVLPPRPLRLLADPVEVRVIVSPSHDRDGRPVAFTVPENVPVPFLHSHHRVTHAVGPERIGGEWWLGRHKTRDYFDVETESARRLWMFRVVETGRWYVHGVFE